MSNDGIVIREIEAKDNSAVEAIIKACFIEFGLPTVGSAYEDIETTRMYESYKGDNEVYYVIDDSGTVVGGGGIKKLRGNENSICELQKMYFSPQIRGKGYGKLLFDKCMDSARSFGYKQCYLESASVLEAAIHIYETHGFKHLKAPLGDTGHYICGVWMIKDL